MSPIDLVCSFIVVFFLLPIVVHSLATGSRPPAGTRLSRYFAAEPRLMLAGNVFLLTISASAMARLGNHYGVIATPVSDMVEAATIAPFMVLLVIYLGLWGRAILRVRRAARAEV